MKEGRKQKEVKIKENYCNPNLNIRLSTSHEKFSWLVSNKTSKPVIYVILK